MMRTVTTTAGFTAELDEAVLDDMELFDAATELERGRVTALSVITEKLLGPQKKALYDSLRDDAGRVPMTAATAAVMEIMNQLGGKNS